MQQATWKYCSSSRNKTRSKYEIIMITKYDFPIPIHFKVDGLQIIVVAKKYIYVCVQFHNWFIHEFEGCFLRGQVSSNGFKVFDPVFNSCIVEP